MTTEQVPEEEFDYHLLFKPPESPPPETAELSLIDKYLKQLAAKELLGGPYVRDYLHEQKRRNCRPRTMRSNCATLVVFLSYLKERNRTSLETITRDDVSSFIEHEPMSSFATAPNLILQPRLLDNRENLRPGLG